MKRLIAIIASIILMLSCSGIFEHAKRVDREKKMQKEYGKFRVDLTKHPDYNYEPDNPLSIKIYDKGFTPLNSNYIVIGKIFLVFLPDANQVLVDETLRKAAAYIGGEGIIFVDEQQKETGLDGEHKTAVLIPFSTMMFYSESSAENNKTVITKKTANVIRWR